MAGTKEKLSKAVLTIGCGNGTEKTKNIETLAQTNEEAFDRLHRNDSGFQTLHRLDMQKINEKGADGQNGTVEVQYNPAGIRYHASISESADTACDTEEDTTPLTTITSESVVDMSFTLVFHRKQPDDCFVQEQMELITDMIRSSPTKWIEFTWADIHMEGNLSAFSGEYDMFDRKGTPVSGHMDITIKASVKAERTEKILDKLEKR